MIAVLALAVRAAPAADWGTVDPGRTTMDAVRAHYGGPTRTTTQKVEGYDTAQWIYEGAQAPPGIARLTVDFGLIAAGDYRADLVRALKLEPKPGIFNRETVLTGWGEPSRVSASGQPKVFFYDAGLVVLFDDEGWEVQSLLFTPPQPPAKDGGVRQP